MKKIALTSLLLGSFALAGASCESSNKAGADDASAASAEVPNPAMSEPDKVAWQLFAQVTAPAGDLTTFETWASDGDTFKPNATFPTGAEATDGLDLHPALIPSVARGRAPHEATLPGDAAAAPASPHALAMPADAAAVTNTAAPAPDTAAPTPTPAPGPNAEPGSIGPQEEVRRNQPDFDYIIGKNTGQPLNSVSGLQAAFAKGFVANFPVDSIEVKTNWLPLNHLVTQFYPSMQAGTPKETEARIRENFYVSKDTDGTEHVLIAMHIMSKLVPSWTWATFEHQLNPGRCDFIGCHDSFGAVTANVDPVDNQGANQGTLYPACAKTDAVKAVLEGSLGKFPAFANYCLKGTQTDYIDTTGLAVRVANSVTEWGFVQQGSCMTCHGMANFGANPNPATGGMMSTTGGGFTPDGNAHIGAIDPTFYWSGGGVSPTPGQSPPIPEGTPGLTRLAYSADFVWSIPFCAYDDVSQRTQPHTPPKSRCAGK